MPGAVGDRLRRAYYRRRLLHLGKDVRIDVGVQIVHPEHVSIGDRVWIDKYAVLLAGPPRERQAEADPTRQSGFRLMARETS